ncbi:hypothetical protein [uncultured Aliiroseovarius sp.]|uniref:hypothetical protein n=1 Tax=uncultured Aliiroseovarius sp. TaxID=1658783 RepID=UPI0025976597|nr:hypothetical protein [uncultured Aliiroseovarius sp.]
MDDYQHLVREFEKKQREREEYCRLTRIQTNALSKREMLPKAVHEGKLLYLGYGRNAWHSTWIRRYYPGSLSFFETDLQKLCETLRVQGSVFRIEPVPAVFIEYPNDVIALVAINDRPPDAYTALMELVLPFRLNGFWGADDFSIQNWLIPLKMAAWRPDLIPKKHHMMTSSPQGAGRPMAWQRREVDETSGGICEAFRAFMPNLLRIKEDQTRM